MFKFTILYLLTSFYELTFNFTQWPPESRSGIIFSLSLLYCFHVVIVFMFILHPEQNSKLTNRLLISLLF
jgi:hypothetical protein